MEQQMIAQIQRTFSQLATPLALLDGNGYRLIPADDTRFTLPNPLQAGEITETDGLALLPVEGSGCVLMANTGISPDVMMLARAMITSLCAANMAAGGANSAYARLLQNELSLAEIEAAVSEFHIPQDLPRCVLLMHMAQVQTRSAQEILEEIIPLSAGDTLVAMDRHTAALIKNAEGLSDAGELEQFARATQETLMGEIALTLTVGIGNTVQTAAELQQSYRQARRAIEIGRVFKADSTVYVYHQLMLERFLSDLPADTAEHYHGLLFNRRTSRLFSPEMLYTIEMFFRKDLNLSDTARQLFIHRNTLVYRLDKVQRQIGLDLRKFEDAVTFKMLFEMEKCVNSKTLKTI